MRFTPFFAAAFLLAPTLTAQANISFATPRGIEFVEGNSSSGVMLGNYSVNPRVQQIDNNLVGLPLPAIRFLGWRRNNAVSSAAKTVELEIKMSHADFATVTSTFATNYKDAPKTVFTRKQINMPDWSAAISAAPFDFNVPLDVPFVYNRQDALLWDVINYNNNTALQMSQDWQSTPLAHSYGAYPTNLGGECRTANGRFICDVMFRADGAGFEFGVQGRNGPSNAAVIAMIGAQDPNVSVPGFCGVLHVLPLLVLGAGQTDASGTLPLQTLLQAPWDPNLGGLPLTTQLLAVDPASSSQPFVFSTGSVAPAPTSNGGQAVNVKRTFVSDATNPTGSSPSDSGVPTTYGI